MLNKRKTHKFDPTRINNYNKFLSTLDKKPIFLNTDNTDNKIDDDEVKQKIDKLIEKRS